MSSEARDTATGTDPDAKYEEPGYEDKSLGQAVNQDQDLVDELLEETDGDEDEAAQRFEDESAGAPALAGQDANPFDPGAESWHASGGQHARPRLAVDDRPG